MEGKEWGPVPAATLSATCLPPSCPAFGQDGQAPWVCMGVNLSVFIFDRQISKPL
jgi:hypothetical protein